jgi:L-serine deaminase
MGCNFSTESHTNLTYKEKEVMPLFDVIRGALSNPNQQASSDQLGDILRIVQQLSNQQGVNPSATQTAMSVVGNYVRSSLQQQRNAQGNSRAEAIVNQFAGTSPNRSALDALFNSNQQQQVAQEASAKSGINASTIQAMLPILVPVILYLLKTGSSKSNAQTNVQTTAANTGGNSVLNAFLDADNSGSVDISDAISLAGRFLSQR